ncbi:hypothetical protein JCM11491_004636 [Sporobolomyces phaffii]
MPLHANLSKLSLAPSYRTVDSSSPSGHRVGKQQDVTFVTPVQLHRHLRILAAFHSLRRKVETADFRGVSDPRAKWTVFAHLAAYRYEVYLKEVVAAGSGSVTSPPLDVAMVFHTHLLNPTVFAEDALRTYPEHQLLSDRLLSQYADEIDPETFEHSPTNEEILNWQNRTLLPFDPLESFATTDGRTISCPYTGDEVHVPWVNEDGSGFAQEGFHLVSTAGPPITHETLGIAKLARDLYDLKSGTGERGIARTVLTAFNAATPGQSSISSSLATGLADYASIKNASSWQDIARSFDYKRDNVSKVIARGVGGTKFFRRINNILEGYTTGTPFSIDLAMATLRQAQFIEKMHQLGWISPGWLETPPDENEILIRCVARYHAYMDLLSSSLFILAVPTLDIDLAWHTHQLHANYRTDTVQVVGRAIDHDDKVEETDLGFGFDDTARLWEERFKVPYHSCGCPHPPTKTLAKLGNKFGRSSASSAAAATLTQVERAHPATHSSEHNAFILAHHPDAQHRRQNRMQEFGERKKKEDKKRDKDAKKGSSTSRDDDEVEKERREHDIFFLAPVPLFERYGDEGHPVSAEGIPVSANQAGTNKDRGTCGGSAGEGVYASVGSCGAASGVFLVAGPSGGGNLAGYTPGYGYGGMAGATLGGVASTGF